MEPDPVGSPQAEAEKIMKTGRGGTRVKKGSKGGEMAKKDGQEDGKVSFMLGFLGGHDDPNAGNEHVELLQVLVTNFQKPEVMDKLVNAKTEDEYMEAVLSMEGL